MRTETARPFGWWWAKYVKNMRSPDHCTFNEYEELYFEPTRGFMCWMITAGMRELFITKCCGDGRYWRDKAFEMYRFAKERYGVKYMITCSTRNPDAYCKMFGKKEFKCGLWKEEQRDGDVLYWFRVEEAE